VVRSGETRTFPITVMMELDRLVDPEMLAFLVEDGAFELNVKVRAEYTMGLTEFRSDESIWYPWDAPLVQIRDLLVEGNLSAAVEEALGWAGPVVRGWITAAVLDASMAEGEWRHQDLSGWGDMSYRLDLNETPGNGSFDVVLVAQFGSVEWAVNGTVPLRLIDGQVYLEQEVRSDVA
jgi:hypothetical protein